MTSADLQTKRDALLGKIADALSRVQSGDKSIDFQSIEQMRAALAIIDGELARLSGSAPTRCTLAEFSKG